MIDYTSNTELLNMAMEDLKEVSGDTMGQRYRTPSPVGEKNRHLSNNHSHPIHQGISLWNAYKTAQDGQEPITPSPEPLTAGWLGLVSPITPKFNDYTFPAEANELENTYKDTALRSPISGREAQTVSHNVRNGEEVQKPCLSEQETTEPKSVSKVSALSDPINPVRDNQMINPCDNDGNGFQYTAYQQDNLVQSQLKLTTEQHETRLVDLPDVSIGSNPVRRSSRLVKLMKKDERPIESPVPTYTVPRKIVKTVALQPLRQTEQTLTSLQNGLIQFKGLPVVHSIDWELQYPPGGGTHPSYPFPNLDPRLIFHENFVPLNNGLPDVHKIPKLLLPVGWRHVSWSGLLPIAFDPYLQGFKLTPVGPLPLTSEELQQNGLYKYVPGGELHPETALLPRMTNFGNGSEIDVYNWDGVDWTLPWTEFNNALDLQFGSNYSQTTADVGRKDSQDGLRGTSIEPFQSIEGWACPDGIIDVADGWRWLMEKDATPTPSFEPTKGKAWKGTGICRVTRRFKQPIASMMATAMANSADTPELYLVNQDGREFCPFKSVATPVHIDISMLRGTEITLKELLCYFPNHYQWPKCANRFLKAGLSGTDIANMINMTRCLSGDATKKKASIATTILHSIRNEGDEIVETGGIRNGQGVIGHTTEDWTYEKWEMSDYPLLALAHGLVSLPEGEDSGPLTMAILWCHAQNRHQTLLNEVPALIAAAGIDNNVQKTAEGCPDQHMLERHRDALKEDRKRVLRSEKMMKTSNVPAEGRVKRRKTDQG